MASLLFPLSIYARHLLWHIFDVAVAVAATSPLFNLAVAVSLISALPWRTRFVPDPLVFRLSPLRRSALV